MQITEINIYNLCKKMGMPIGFNGFKYVKDMILLVDEEVKNRIIPNIKITKLYDKLALKYNVKSTAVERATRYFIETGFNRIKPRFIEEIFGFTEWYNGYPPNKEFIMNVYEYMIYEGEENV